MFHSYCIFWYRLVLSKNVTAIYVHRNINRFYALFLSQRAYKTHTFHVLATNEQEYMFNTEPYIFLLVFQDNQTLDFIPNIPSVMCAASWHNIFQKPLINDVLTEASVMNLAEGELYANVYKYGTCAIACLPCLPAYWHRILICCITILRITSLWTS